MNRSATAMALVESIGMEDPTLIEEARLASIVSGQDVSAWIDEGGECLPIVHPLLAFEARRGDRQERVALHVAKDSGRLAIAIARPGPDGWRRHFDITIDGQDMHPLVRTLGLATGDGAARTVAIGQRIGLAVAAAL